jgi:cysteine synthase
MRDDDRSAAVASRDGLGLGIDMVDEEAYRRTVARFREQRVALPTFSQLADPASIPAPVRAAVEKVSPDEARALNLYRVHWHNRWGRPGLAPVPEHVELPRTLTGVDARIVVVFGNRFPMIGAHKVLAAYACLVPRLVSGRFDPTIHRAVWPSTGNYARGGVAISRIMGCRGVAVLPEGMSRERFDWLDRWVERPEDIVRTPGTESNVKEIYDKCAELRLDAGNVILNQFSEFANHLAHLRVTGAALERVFDHVTATGPAGSLAAFVSASGSAGTLGAGDHLKERHGARVVAVEALECPTMLENGYGEHNIQGIGDKHIPLIHNVTNTDLVVAISDRSTDSLDALFNTAIGRRFLVDRAALTVDLVEPLGHLGLSSICNVLAAIKTAKHLDLGSGDVVMTVATDGAEMYASERSGRIDARFPGGFDELEAASVFGRHLLGADTSALLELGAHDRRRIFNLGYYTWVEQQGVDVAAFDARRDQAFWRQIRTFLDECDERIVELNERTGVLAELT